MYRTDGTESLWQRIASYRTRVANFEQPDVEQVIAQMRFVRLPMSFPRAEANSRSGAEDRPFNGSVLRRLAAVTLVRTAVLIPAAGRSAA